MSLGAAACAGDGTFTTETELETSLPPSSVPPTSTRPTSVDANAVSTVESTSAVTTPMPQLAVSGDELRIIIEQRLLVDGASSTLADRTKALEIPGAAIVVVADGEAIVELAVGTTPDGHPMATDTVLQVGSVSKAVAAVVVAALVDDGTIGWESDVLASLDGVDLGGPPGHTTTFEMLLSHTGGTNVDGFLGYATTEAAPTVADVIAGRGDTEAIAITFPPGAGFVYSGGGTVVAAEAATAAAEAASFDDLARAEVFEPLGMLDSAYSLDPPTAAAGRVSIGSVGLDPLDNGWQRHPEHAAAGLWTTADDLARFLAGFGSSLAGRDGALLNADVATAMVTPVAAIDGAGPGESAIGRGWVLDDPRQPTVHRHSGRNIGYTAEIAGTVDGRFGVVVVTNSFPGGTTLAREVIATVADALRWQP